MVSRWKIEKIVSVLRAYNLVDSVRVSPHLLQLRILVKLLIKQVKLLVKRAYNLIDSVGVLHHLLQLRVLHNRLLSVKLLVKLLVSVKLFVTLLV